MTEIVPTKREVIEKRLLTALTEEDKVAVVCGRDDLDLLIKALSRKNEKEFKQGLIELRDAAFGRRKP